MSSMTESLLLEAQSLRNNANNGAKIGEAETIRRDEREADELLRKMGYRLRLSSAAFGYPACGCRRNDDAARQPSRTTESSSEPPPLAAIDDSMPPSMFDALRRAFGPGSRYWSEFYREATRTASGATDRDAAVESGAPTHREVEGTKGGIPRRKKRTNRFASHNVPLPSAIDASHPSSSLLLRNLQRSKSLFEQVAIVARHRLAGRFPDLADATSVEVWSHRRPPDGQHQLHYDMDEILLWERRKEEGSVQREFAVGKGKDPNDDDAHEGGAAKRRKTGRGIGNGADIERTRRRPGTCEDGGISCPIASCVLTIYVPTRSGTCAACGAVENGAPTIVCDQSITRDSDGTEATTPNVGRLCRPRPNRLLAFEGSLLHGVMPGMPSARSSGPSDDEDESYGSDDSCELGAPEAGRKDPCGDDQRVTLMMGFWKDVRLTSTVGTSDGSTAPVEIGPNVPFGSVSRKDSWTREFDPVSIDESDVADVTTTEGGNESEDVTVLDPLWVPIRDATAAPEEDAAEFASRGRTEEFNGRFFLRSLDPTSIDREVLGA